MPVVFRWNGHRFHFFANEGDPREPSHIHVSRAATFTALAEATSDAASSNIVLSHAASCIFSPHDTGYIKHDGDHGEGACPPNNSESRTCRRTACRLGCDLTAS